MSKLQTAIVNFDEAIQKVAGKSVINRTYISIRNDAAKILDQYKEDPLNTDLVEKCTNIVRRIENLNYEKLSSTNNLRAKSNIVYISALSKRTHYAAYMAGVWSTDKSISKPFKAWLHNSAADGAISLYEASLPFIIGKKKKSSKKLLSIFAEGAIHDAERFLEMADKYYPECAATRYNKAKVDIFHIERDRVRQGVENLKSIPCPSADSEAPELIWHVDNYESYCGDLLMRERIQKETPESLPQIDSLLSKNNDEAKMQIDARGTALWIDYHPYAKAALVGASTGIVLTMYAVLGDVSLMDLIGVANAHADVTAAATNMHQSALGGGGLASLDFSRAMGFGGGGLA